MLEGGHGEVFQQIFQRRSDDIGSDDTGSVGTKVSFQAAGPFASLRPDAALAEIGALAAVGNGVRHLVAVAPDLAAVEMLPDAASAVLLAPDDTALPARPIYGRAPDAKPPAARIGVPA